MKRCSFPQTQPNGLRVAIYFTPSAETRLTRTASSWFGRPTFDSRLGSPPDVPEVSRTRLERILQTPQHYGFHATLKPPFRLKAGIVLEDVHKRLERFSASLRPFMLPPLYVSLLGDFVCLRPASAAGEFDNLAARAVRFFDEFRLAPTEEELTRRRRANLSRRQEQLLVHWGYPYVFDEFRCHFTLTGRMSDSAEQQALFDYLTSFFADALREPVLVDGVSLFLERNGQPFLEVMRCRLGL